MLAFPLLSAFLLPLGSWATASASDAFSQFSKLPVPIKTTDATFFKLTSQPRDYAVAVMMTALDSQFRCTMCRDMQPEWDMLATSWKKADKNGESRMLFSTLDFADGKKAFDSLSLQTAPFIMLFPPTTGPNARPSGPPIAFDFSTGPLSAESMHTLISRSFPDMKIPAFKRPTDFVQVGLVFAGLVGAVTLVYITAPYVIPVLQNRDFWAAICLILILLFTTGQMFNQIRRVPYVAGNGQGGISYFASGFQNQFGMETQIVAAIYGALSFATIYLAVKSPRIVDPRRQKISVTICGCAIVCVYSFLMNIFRMKNPSYPFSIPPF